MIKRMVTKKIVEGQRSCKLNSLSYKNFIDFISAE